MKFIHLLAFGLFIITTTACMNNSNKRGSKESGPGMTGGKIKLEPGNFQRELDGKQVSLFFLKNKNGLELAVTNYGAKVVALLVPDKEGKFEDIVLGFDDLDGYLNANEPYFGAAIGRSLN
jgi:aldose 1-epimerase